MADSHKTCGMLVATLGETAGQRAANETMSGQFGSQQVNSKTHTAVRKVLTLPPLFPDTQGRCSRAITTKRCWRSSAGRNAKIRSQTQPYGQSKVEAHQSATRPGCHLARISAGGHRCRSRVSTDAALGRRLKRTDHGSPQASCVFRAPASDY